MDIDPQRKTWSNFIKLTTYTSVSDSSGVSVDGYFFALRFYLKFYFNNELLTF